MQKTAHFRKVVWLRDLDNVLSEVLQECFEGVAARIAPVFNYGDGLECMVAFRRPAANPTFFHFVLYEVGAPAAVIARAARVAPNRIDEVAPPEGNEFIRGQMYCLVVENDLVWVAHGALLKENRVHQFLAQFILSQIEDMDLTAFHLQPIVDEAVCRRAFADGIEEIDLGLGGFQSTLEMIQRGGRLPENGFLASMGDIFRNRATNAELAAAQHVKGRISFRPGKKWNAPHVTELLSKMARDVLENQDDEFTIITKGGLRLTREKMSISRELQVDGNDRVLNANQVEMRLRDFMGNLNDLDVLG